MEVFLVIRQFGYLCEKVNAVICEKGLIGYLFNRLIGRRDYIVNLVIWDWEKLLVDG